LTPWEMANEVAVLDPAGAEAEPLGEVGVAEAPEAELLLEAPEVADAAGVELGAVKVTPTLRQRP